MPADNASASPDVRSKTSDPVVDVAGHLRDLRSVALLALVLGLVIGVLVFTVRSLWPATYQVVTTAKVVSAAAVSNSPTVAQAAGAPFVALSADSAVLEETAKQVGLERGSDVTSHITVTLSQATGLVDITATAPTLGQATKIAETLIAVMDATSVERASKISVTNGGQVSAQIAALDERIRKASAAGGDQSQVASLYTQRDELTRALSGRTESEPARLQLLAEQTGDGSPASPKPLGEAGVAAIISAVLAAEAIVLANGRFGSKVSPAWARRVARRRGIDIDSGEVEPGRTIPLGTDLVCTRLLNEGATLLFLGDITGLYAPIVPEEQEAEEPDPEQSEAEESAPEVTKPEVTKAEVTKAEVTKPEVTKAEESPAEEPQAEDESTSDAPVDDLPENPERTVFLPASSRWWEETDLSDVSLVLVVADEGLTYKDATVEVLDRLDLVEIPARLVLRESGDFSGPLGWLKI